MPLIELDHVLAGQRADRFARALDGVAVRMARIHEPHQLTAGHRLRILLGALDRRLDLLHPERELVLRERRGADDLREDPDALADPFGRRAHKVEPQGIGAATVGVEARAGNEQDAASHRRLQKR